MADGFTRVCAVDEVPDEDSKAVEVDGVAVAVVRSGGEFFAIKDVCSHAEVALSEGDVEDCTIECWLHGSQFDLRTGKPTSLPATEPVPVYPTQVSDGQVYVSLTTDALSQEPVK